jgi:hypothetical protein
MTGGKPLPHPAIEDTNHVTTSYVFKKHADVQLAAISLVTVIPLYRPPETSRIAPVA